MFRPLHVAFHAAALAGALAVGCGSRSELLYTDTPVEEAGLTVPDAGEDAPPDAPPDAVRPDAPPPPADACVPTEELCNGADDDCNGEVDEVAPLPCPSGGFRYCVAGAYSECPQRCELCMPGSERVCFIAYCDYWGVQTCTADGRSFGACKEQRAPTACKAVAREHQYSRELEQCCIDSGYCCLDRFDLDGDGDKGETLGSCEELSCDP